MSGNRATDQRSFPAFSLWSLVYRDSVSWRLLVKCLCATLRSLNTGLADPGSSPLRAPSAIVLLWGLSATAEFETGGVMVIHPFQENDDDDRGPIEMSRSTDTCAAEAARALRPERLLRDSRPERELLPNSHRGTLQRVDTRAA